MSIIYLLKQLFFRIVDASKIFKEKGIQAGFTELCRTIARIFYQRAEYVVLTNRLSESGSTVQPQSDLMIRQPTTPEEIANLSSITNPADMARFQQLFDRGSTAFVAYQEEQIVGYCWFSQEMDESVGRVGAGLDLRPGEVYAHDLFTSPAHRRKGIAKSLVSHRMRHLREHRFKQAIAVVEKENIPSLRALDKTGYKCVGELYHIRILFWDHFRQKVYGQDTRQD